MYLGSRIDCFWACGGFDDFVAKTLDRYPEGFSPSVIIVNDQYFLGCVLHVVG